MAVTYEQLPEKPIQTHSPAVTTISVLNLERLKLSNTGAVTVTDLLYGQNGQEVSLLGDGNTTIAHGTPMKTNTGANKLMAANRVYRFVRFDGVWYEQ